MKLQAFKFMILAGEKHAVPLAPEDQPGLGSEVKVDGCLAIAVAENEAQARELLLRRAEEFGHDARWLKVAKVVVLSIDNPTTLCWVDV